MIVVADEEDAERVRHFALDDGRLALDGVDQGLGLGLEDGVGRVGQVAGGVFLGQKTG